MRLPKKTKRYCPYCKKHTEHKLSLASSGHTRSSLKKGSKQRARLRGRARGMGNLGKYSKPAVGQWKRKVKSTKKTNVLYTCAECKKAHTQRKGKRAGRVQLGSKEEKQ